MSDNETEAYGVSLPGVKRPIQALRFDGANRQSRAIAQALGVFFLALGLSPLAAAQSSDFIVYPAKGQSAEQQKRDRADCHVWAVDQTGFDPTRVTPPPTTITTTTEQGRAVGSGAVAGGAARGAAVGAVGGAIGGNAGKGAAIGAASGALIGGMRHRRETRPQTITETNPDYSDYKAKLNRYKKATKACLSARGYGVE
jgi:hypothetical protein